MRIMVFIIILKKSMYVEKRSLISNVEKGVVNLQCWKGGRQSTMLKRGSSIQQLNVQRQVECTPQRLPITDSIQTRFSLWKNASISWSTVKNIFGFQNIFQKLINQKKNIFVYKLQDCTSENNPALSISQKPFIWKS